MNKKLEVNNLGLFDKLILFILIFSQFFFHRYTLILDFTLISSLLLVIVRCFPNYKIYIDPSYMLILVFLMLLLFYSTYIQFLHSHFDVFLIGRIIRCLIFFFLFPMILFMIRPEFILILKIFVYSILFHSIAVILQVLIPDPLLFISADYVNLSYKNIILAGQLLKGRGFGLASSFDMAGIVNIIGIIFCLYLYMEDRKKSLIYILLIGIFFATGIFTGRFFMILGSIIAFYSMMVIFIKSNTFFHKILILIFIFLGLPYAVAIFYEVLAPTINYTLTGDLPSDNFGRAGIGGKGYYYGTITYILETLFILPKDWLALLFGGDLLRVAHSDSGTIKLIYSTGIFGTILHYLIYIIMFLQFKNYSDKSIFYLIIIPITFTLLIFDIKHIMFLSRGLYETLLILLISLIIRNERNENRNNSKL